MTVNDCQIYGAMIDGVEHVSNLITRYTIVETVFLGILPQAKAAAIFRSSLIKLYATILTYLAAANRYYDKSTVGKHLSDIAAFSFSIVRAED